MTMTVQERYSNSAEAHSLIVDTEHHAADVLIAAGMVAARKRDMRLATNIYRLLYANEARQFGSVLHALIEAMEIEGKHKHWPPDHEMAVCVTRAVLMWHIVDVCPVCLGRAYKLVPGTPMLSDEHCPSCNGYGKTSLARVLRQYGASWTERGAWLSGYINTLICTAGDRMIKKLSAQVNAF